MASAEGESGSMEPAGAPWRADHRAFASDSDLHPYHQRETGIASGTVVGHEFVGTIVEAGAEVRRLYCHFTHHLHSARHALLSCEVKCVKQTG